MVGCLVVLLVGCLVRLFLWFVDCLVGFLLSGCLVVWLVSC